MRTHLPLLPVALLSILACGGAPTAPDKAPATAAATAAAPAKPAKQRAKPADDPTLSPLSGQYLVIVASKLVAAEADAALTPVRAVPGTAPRTLPSARFKNLMPCYTVAIAGSSADKKEAAALSKALKAAGIDNYIKNAGALVPPSAALDAWCAARQAPVTGGAVQLVLSGGGKSWVPVAGSVPDGLPPAVALDKEYGAWEQRIGPGSGAWSTISVDGTAKSCNGVARSAVTIGTPHFGVLQAESPPSGPQCGSPQPAEELNCSFTAPAVAVPAGSPAPAAWPGAPAPDLTAAATAALASRWSGSGQRAVTVTRHTAGAQSLLLVAGTESDDGGVCGGYSATHFAVFMPAEQGAGLGRQLGGWQDADFVSNLWLLDADGDSVPEILAESFPNTLRLSRVDGATVAEQRADYCDCPC